MNGHKKLVFSRPLWVALFLLLLALIYLISYLVSLKIPPITVAGAVFLLISGFNLAMLFREMISPSIIERTEDGIRICWNNWTLSGKLANAGFEGKNKLLMVITDASIALVPVGPMMAAAGFLLKPMLNIFLPSFLAQSFYFNKEALAKKIVTMENQCRLAFPVFLLGKRKVKKWLG